MTFCVTVAVCVAVFARVGGGVGAIVVTTTNKLIVNRVKKQMLCCLEALCSNHLHGYVTLYNDLGIS